MRFAVWLLLATVGIVARGASTSDEELVLIRIKYTVDTRQERQRNDWNAKGFAKVLPKVAELLNRTISIKAAPEPKVLELTDEAIFSCPFLFMAGHFGLDLSETEVINLRTHLNKGGFLLATACCGNPSFVASFEREMKKVFPDKELLVVPRDHLVYSALYKLPSVTCITGADSTNKRREFTPLRGIELDGRMAVVFSPVALTCGWSGSDRCIPSCKRVAPEDALKIAANVVVYALTH